MSDNLINFDPNKRNAEAASKWMEEFYQRNKRAKADILASLERLDNGDELYSLWMEINWRLIEKHGFGPDSLAQLIIDYCVYEEAGE